ERDRCRSRWGGREMAAANRWRPEIALDGRLSNCLSTDSRVPNDDGVVHASNSRRVGIGIGRRSRSTRERVGQSMRLFFTLLAGLAMAATFAVVSVESTSAQPVTCGNGLLDLGEDCDLSSPAGAFCPPGQVCSSSCDCAFLATLTTTTTTSTTTLVTSTTLLDHFQCYEIRKQSITAGPVTVQDQFGSSTVTLSKPIRLCAPTNKLNEDPGAENDPDHLLAWQDKQNRPTVLNQTVVNQFGTL